MTLANLALRLKSPPGRVPAAIQVTDEVRRLDPTGAAARLPPGTGVLLRHYGAADRRAIAMALAAAARRRRLVLLVAADWRLAAAVGAAGVHLPEALARRAVLAPLLGWRRRRRALLTVACHSPMALARARTLGADAALLSPAFPTASHPGASCLGPVRFRTWAAQAGVPVVALGGVTVRRMASLGRRAAGAAAIGGWD